MLLKKGEEFTLPNLPGEARCKVDGRVRDDRYIGVWFWNNSPTQGEFQWRHPGAFVLPIDDAQERRWKARMRRRKIVA